MVHRDSEWQLIVNNYMDTLVEWLVVLDREDGSTAPFTSLVMEEVCSQL